MKPPREIPAKTAEEAAAAEAQLVELAKRIDFYLTEYSVELLAKKVVDGEFVVPNYQREFTWEPERKSRFIESLLLGLPIPFLFFWEMPDGKLEIVDGSQRLRTLSEFIHGGFRIGELESLTLLSGFKYSELPESRRRKTLNRSIRGIVLNEHADEQARFDLFERINTGSKIANHAEVRRGALTGPFMDLVAELADMPIFIELAPASKKDVDERARDELVTRFFAYGDGLEGYKDCVNRRRLPPIPCEACHPDRSKAATHRSVATRVFSSYPEALVSVNVACRFRMDSPRRLIL